jgi:hypothetical protein
VRCCPLWSLAVLPLTATAVCSQVSARCAPAARRAGNCFCSHAMAKDAQFSPVSSGPAAVSCGWVIEIQPRLQLVVTFRPATKLSSGVAYQCWAFRNHIDAGGCQPVLLFCITSAGVEWQHGGCQQTALAMYVGSVPGSAECQSLPGPSQLHGFHGGGASWVGC